MITNCASAARYETGEIEGYYLRSDGEEPPEDIEEDEYEVMGEDNTIELLPLIQTALLLELPYLPLCREDCAGICPDCGTNLNEGTCDCSSKKEEEAFNQSPFAILKNLKIEDRPSDNE